MLDLTETDIRQWADRQQCRNSLPILVRKLVRETTQSIELMRFPGNEAVDLAGLDGELVATTGTVWVPPGRSFWEMGCNLSPVQKANSDFKKRAEEVEASIRAESSFVFVTPRRWPEKPSKDDWIKERKQKSDWKDIRVFDAIDLEAWLDEAPATARWLADLMGKASTGVLTPDEWWKRWATASEPAITTKLIVSRRGDPAKKLLEQLRSDARVVAVSGDDHSEAAAFVLAAMYENNAEDLLDRTIVVTKGDVAIAGNDRSRLIVLADLPDGSDIDLRDRSGITLVRTYPKGRLDVREPLELSHVPAESFRSELEAMGFQRENANSLAIETGHSVTVLRRQLSKDPEIRRPIWARDREAAIRLLPFALTGAWSDRSEYDDTAILALLGDVSEDDLAAARDHLLTLEDAPLARYGSNNLIVSRIDALFAIGSLIQKTDLERFFALVPELVSERDPALDLPSEKWWMANVLGKSRTYSGALLAGIGDTLCILAIHGDDICGRRLNIDLSAWVEQAVRKLLSDVDRDGWLSIRGQLRTLAEASPAAFLDCLEAELRKADPPIQAILGVVDGGISGDCLRTDLLWGLEALAWHPDHFKRVAAILFELRRFDALMDDNWANKPASSARDMFRVQSPITVMDIRSRMTVLEELGPRYRAPTIEQLISMLPSGFGGMIMLKSRPRWRVPEADIVPPQRADFEYSIRQASRQLLDMAPFSFAEMKLLLEAADRLHPEDLDRLADDVERWASASGNDDQKANLRHILRREATSRAYQKRAEEDDGLVPAFRRMEAATEPTAAVYRHRWLFDSSHIEWSRLVRDEETKELSWKEREAIVRERRLEALEDIKAADGEASILDFALSTKSPYVVADLLVRSNTPPAEAIGWAKEILETDETEGANEFLRAIFWNRADHDLTEIAIELAAALGSADESVLKRLATSLPGIRAGWEAAAALGPAVETEYWNSVHIRAWNDTEDSEAEFAAKRLLEFGRARSAFAALHYVEGKVSNPTWIEILTAITRGGEPEGPFPDSYSLDQILKKFDDDPEIPRDTIAQIELPFVPLLNPYGHRDCERTLEVYHALARDPEDFIQLLRWLYCRKDRAEEAEFEGMDDDHRKLLADIAYHTFEGWDVIPGTDESGEIDSEKFAEWNAAAFKLAKEADRFEVAGSRLGALYGRLARRRSWDDWLPDPILKLLDAPEHQDLRQSFAIGVRNARGMTSRSPYDGGAQERNLAQKYRELAARFGNSYPRVAELLKEIAKGYEWDAKREDEQAAVGERWHP